MNGYVTDANVIFSCLISGRDIYQEIFNQSNFYLPDFALREIQEYQDLILKKTQLNPYLLKDYTLEIFKQIIVVPNFLISTQSYFQAFRLCKDIDEKDTPYLALSIEFDMPLLSNDKELVQGLSLKGYEKIISLKDFFDQL